MSLQFAAKDINLARTEVPGLPVTGPLRVCHHTLSISLVDSSPQEAGLLLMIQNKNFIYVLIREAVWVRTLTTPVTTMKVLSLSILLPTGQSGPSSLYTLSILAQEGFSGPC